MRAQVLRLNPDRHWAWRGLNLAPGTGSTRQVLESGHQQGKILQQLGLGLI